MDGGADLATLLRNTETAEKIERRVKERMFEEELAPKALAEKLPTLPGVKK